MTTQYTEESFKLKPRYLVRLASNPTKWVEVQNLSLGSVDKPNLEILEFKAWSDKVEEPFSFFQ
jgi:hypothetical protein